MKAFSLEEYLKNPSKKLVTRDGRKARIVATDIKCKNFPIVAAVTYRDGQEVCLSYTSSGKYSPSVTKDYNDLFFAPEKKEGWISIYKTESGDIIPGNYIDESEELSRQRSVPYSFSVLIKTIKIEWEE